MNKILDEKIELFSLMKKPLAKDVACGMEVIKVLLSGKVHAWTKLRILIGKLFVE